MSYTATATAIAGRNGHVESNDGVLKLDLSLPKQFGGAGKAGATNPEQLFAAGYAACFGSAIDAMARAEKVAVSQVSVTADITLNKDDSGFFLSAKLVAKIDGTDRETADKLVKLAHEICPYSKATRNNIEVHVQAA